MKKTYVLFLALFFPIFINTTPGLLNTNPSTLQSVCTIGQMVLRHPVIQIIGTAVNLANICLTQHDANIAADIRATIPANATLERIQYDHMRSELFKLRNDFLKIKDGLEQIVKYYRPYQVNFKFAFTDIAKSSDIPNCFLNINTEQELGYNDAQKTNLTKLRQADLDQIGQQILDLQISLAFHFDELINAKNKAYKQLYDQFFTDTALISLWNSNTKNMPNHIAVSCYESILGEKEQLLYLEIKNQELKIAIEYYKHSQNDSILQKTTNISELIDQEEKEVKSLEDFIHKIRITNVGKEKIVRHYFLSRNINLANLNATISAKIKKGRESKIAKELTEAQQRRACIQAPQGPKKDENKNKSFFEKLKDRSDREVRTNEFGKIYRDPETKLWWSKDTGGHGGPHYKVFKERATGLEWQFDADVLGQMIVKKHKGPTGIFIHFKEVIFLR